MPNHLSSHHVRVVNYVFTSIAVVVTCLRLLVRARTAGLWWDDAWALIAMLFSVVFMAAMDVHRQTPDKHSLSAKVVVAYLCAQFYYAVIWSTRLSILLTVIRLSFGKFRRLLVYTGVAFVITWLILFAQVWWVCETNSDWKKHHNPACPHGINFAISHIITGLVSDAILVFAPLRLVWRAKLSRAQRIRLMTLFSTTIISTAFSLNQGYFIVKTGGGRHALASILQCTMGLIVANLSVIVAFFFRIKTEEHDKVTTGPAGAAPVSFLSLN